MASTRAATFGVSEPGSWVALAVLLVAPFLGFPADFVSRALLDGGDDLVANIPELVYSARKLLEGEVLWTPELWMGHPILGEPEFATFYLPKLLLLLGPPVVMYAAYLLLHYLVAELGAFLYLRSLGLGRPAAVFGALSYAYAGFMLGHRAHTNYVCAGAWAPLVLYFCDRAADRGGRVNCILAAAAFAMLPLSGAVQLSVYLFGTVLLLSLTVAVLDRSLRQLVGAAACLIPGLLLSAVQLLPSHHFSRQLATEMRGDYALDVMHSFHPALLPTLAVPVSPIDAELYSRVGVVALCATAVALSSLGAAPARVRAWVVVLGLSALLMLGRYFPPLARAVHGLPVVGVLRGPVRHNFELALAVTVLAAYGFDRARSERWWSLLRWVAVAASTGALSYVAVRLARTGYVGDAATVSQLEPVTLRPAIVAAVAFAAWLLAWKLRDSPRGALLFPLVAVVPLLETAWAMRVEAAPNRSALGIMEAPAAALPEGSSVRLMSVSLLRGSADSLAGNSVLLHPGVGSVQGYSSIVYSDAQELLELDMHGQPRFYHQLAFSTLPSVFGVTHVVLPSIACGDTRLVLGAPGQQCTRSRSGAVGAGQRTTAIGTVSCTGLTTDSTWAYRLTVAGAPAPRDDERGVTFGFLGGPRLETRFETKIPPSAFPAGFRISEPVNVAAAESWGALLLRNQRRMETELSGVALRADRSTTSAALDGAGPEERLTFAEIHEDAVRLIAGARESRVERPVRRPGQEELEGRTVTLEVVARGAPGAGDLVVDVYSEGGYDPEDAQIVVPGRELGPTWRTFARPVSLGDAPEEFLLRAFVLGGGPVEIREARLALNAEEVVYDVPVASYRDRPMSRVDGDRIWMSPEGRLGDHMHLPLRAFDVVLDARAPEPLGGPVRFGFEAATSNDLPRSWEIAPGAFPGRTVHQIALLPPDIRDAKLFVHVAGDHPLVVNELSATDACAVREYREPRRLANGLFLYENPRALPRAYAVAETVPLTDLVEIRRELLGWKREDLGTKAVVTGDTPPGLRRGVVEHASFAQRTNDLVVRAEDGPTLLVVNDRFDPDWVATVDGADVSILRVNGLVRGVVVPEGTHRVHLEYRAPLAVWLGAALALLGALLAWFAAPWALRRACR